MRSVDGECDRKVAAVTAVASKATARSPVIVRCFIMRTSVSEKCQGEEAGTPIKITGVCFGLYSQAAELISFAGKMVSSSLRRETTSQGCELPRVPKQTA